MRMRSVLSVGLIVAGLGIIVCLSVSAADPTSLHPGFFSDDQGATFFVDVTTRIAPFDHQGKEAVHADVFTCDDNKTKFVGYLDRYTAEMKNQLDNPPRDLPGQLALMQEAAAKGVEIAAPHSQRWFNRNSVEGQKIIDGVRCPAGSQNNLTLGW